MDWLGLDYDEGPVYQTARIDRYREVAEQMIAQGKAYYAYETREQLTPCARRRWPARRSRVTTAPRAKPAWATATTPTCLLYTSRCV